MRNVSPVLLIGLRDYGTASWEGGDAECDHLGPIKQMQAGFNERYFGNPPVETDKQSAVRHAYRECCGKCGARRVDQQLGLESTVDEYVGNLVEVFREVKRVLRDDGVLFLNLGDSYAGGKTGNTNGLSGSTLTTGTRPARRAEVEHAKDDNVTRGVPSGLKPKDLIGIPWRVAFALQADGWYLRSDIIWSKLNPMPESVRDRPTKSHEYIFLLSKSARYFWDQEAVKEPAAESVIARAAYKNGGTKLATNSDRNDGDKGQRTSFADHLDGRNIRSVWSIATHPYAEAHFATFPPDLAERCIKAGTKEGDTVLDPFAGAGTVSLVAERLGRDSIGVELNPEYVRMSADRIRSDCPMFATVETT